jgi:hypothetical protein
MDEAIHNLPTGPPSEFFERFIRRTRDNGSDTRGGGAGSVCCRGWNLPQGADWHGTEFVAERQGGCSGVEDDAGDKVIAETVGESA